MKLLLFLLRLAEGEGTVGHRDVVADVRQLDGGPVPLRIDRGPAVHLQTAGRVGIAQKGERQLSVRRVLRPRDEDAGIAVRQDLRLALEIRRSRQKRAERRLFERPAALLSDLVIEEVEALAVGYDQQVAAAVLKAHLAGTLDL